MLLPHVEAGTISLIGATTHNPFFYINSTLLSRSQLFELKPLSQDEIKEILRRAIKNKTEGLGLIPVEVKEEALDHLAQSCDGDARKALNALEVGVRTTPKQKYFDLKLAEESIQKKQVHYDQDEDAHYECLNFLDPL